MQLSLSKFTKNIFVDSNIYVVAAPEESLALQDYLCSELLDGSNFILHQYVVERGFDFEQITNLLLSGSLFNDNNCIALSFKTKPTADQVKKILQLYPLLNEYNKLILKTGKLDKKDLTQEWLSQQLILIQLTNSQDESSWLINYYLSQAKLTIENSAKQLLIDYTQGNITQLLQELKQLIILFKSGEVISRDHLVNNLMDSSNNTVFNLSSSYLRGDLHSALRIVDNLYQSESDLVLIMWMLSEDITRLIQIKGAIKNNSTLRSIAPSLRIWGNAVNDFEHANLRINYAILLNALDKLAKVDFIVKGLCDGNGIMEIKQVLTMLARGV